MVGEGVAARNLKREVVEVWLVEMPQLRIVDSDGRRELRLILSFFQRYSSIVLRSARLAVLHYESSAEPVVLLIPQADVEAYSTRHGGRDVNIPQRLLATDMQSYRAVDASVVAPVERPFVGQRLVGVGVGGMDL